MLRFVSETGDPALMWLSLPELHWAWNVPQVKPGAISLAVQSNRSGVNGKLPVLIWQRFGSGQVLFHATDELWQWRQGREDAVYGRYWGQALRQLCRAKLLGTERTLKLTSDRWARILVDGKPLRIRGEEAFLPTAPFDLPADKYSIWRTITWEFDPSQMM